MRLGLLIIGGWAVLYGQNCVPVGIVPGAQVSAALDSSACTLSDGTPYAAYALTLPVRGQLQINLTPGDGTIGLILRDGTGAQLAAGISIRRPVESGSYTILVNGQKAGQSGAYQLQPLFTAEPAMWCTAFPNLGLNQTITGSLGSSGCAAPDGTAYEAYSVSTFGAGTLSVSVSAANLNALLTVRDSDGNPLASGANSVTATLAAGSQYQVVVGLVDNTGAYQLATSFQAAAGETCLPQKSFANPGTDTSAITGTSCSMALDGSGDLQFYNYYLVTVANPGLVEMSASSSDFHPTLYLLDASGNQLGMDAESAGAGDSDIRMQLPAGNYIVELFSDAASGGGNYTFTCASTPGNPQGCQTAALAIPPSAVSATLSPSSCRTSLGPGDIYSITLPSAGLLSASLTSGTFTPEVAIRDAKDGLVVSSEDVEGLGAASVSALLPAGSYTVVAAAAAGAGAYQLTPGFAAQPIPACTTPTPLAPNSGYIQNIGGSGCFAPDGQPADFYQFTLPADGAVAAIMTSTDVAGFLTLADANGNFLRSDTDSYSVNDPMIVQFLKAGTYQLAARAAGAGSAGLYQVTLLNSAGDRPAFCAPLAMLMQGTVSGILSYTSCQYTDGTFADIYEISLSASVAVGLTLTTGAFDPYLVLLDAKGNVVAQADDGGTGNTSQITRQLNAGSYFVAAKPFSGYGSVGPYQLTFQQQ
ncbi:MAG TPA: DVUA0089 family protein [Bryobacteraceae bacterium]|nr:DVUA0089 family protein [Bryobacteraceae bacterium]